MFTKPYLCTIALLFCGVILFAQEGKKFNQFSVETAYGFIAPSNLVTAPNQKADYAGIAHFDLGVRYMIASNLGLKLIMLGIVFRMKLQVQPLILLLLLLFIMWEVY